MIKAHRLLYHSTLGWGVITKKKRYLVLQAEALEMRRHLCLHPEPVLQVSGLPFGCSAVQLVRTSLSRGFVFLVWCFVRVLE